VALAKAKATPTPEHVQTCLKLRTQVHQQDLPVLIIMSKEIKLQTIII
jgi:hypothetical protein